MMLIPVSLALMLTPVGQVDLASLIEQALDEPVGIEIEDKSLPEAFVVVADETGVPLHIRPETLALLPHGPATRLTARMNGVPLRDGLDRLLKPIGLTWRVTGDHVEVFPGDALERIGRRATWNELRTLEWAGSHDWTNSAEDASELRRRVQFRVNDADAEGKLLEAMSRVGAGNAGEVLSIACAANGWTWFPWGKRIAIVSATEQGYRELEKPITLRAEHRRLEEVLVDLSRSAGEPIRLEPGTLAALPREVREDFSVLLENVPVRRALDVIGGATGLTYRVESDGIVLSNPHPPAAPQDDPVVVRITLPGKAEVVIRKSDLTERKQKSIERLVDQLVEELSADESPSP